MRLVKPEGPSSSGPIGLYPWIGFVAASSATLMLTASQVEIGLAVSANVLISSLFLALGLLALAFRPRLSKPFAAASILLLLPAMAEVTPASRVVLSELIVVLTSCFLAMALALRRGHHRAGVIALATAGAFWLFSAMAHTFGLAMFAGTSTALPTVLSLVLLVGISAAYADLDLLGVVFSRRSNGLRTRLMLASVIFVPWVLGVALHRGFGVQAREIPVEAITLTAITVCLVGMVLVFAQQAERAEELRRQQLETMKERAVTDALTSLPNRHGTLDILERAWQSFRDGGPGSAVILFDLDHFKSINDSFGHDAGDRILASIHEAVAPFMRRGDIVGRWGGEEFLCVLPGVEEAQIYEIGERLRSAIEGLTIPLSKEFGAPCLISASFGMAEFAKDDVGFNAAITRADSALYESKKAGRNRISLRAKAKAEVTSLAA